VTFYVYVLLFPKAHDIFDVRALCFVICGGNSRRECGENQKILTLSDHPNPIGKNTYRHIIFISNFIVLFNLEKKNYVCE
jgi:hypothetical protein